MLFRSSENAPTVATALTEQQRKHGKRRVAPAIAGVAFVAVALTGCDKMLPGSSLPSESATASGSPSASESAGGKDGVLTADGLVTEAQAAEWCSTIQADAYAGLSSLFPDSTKTTCRSATTGSALSGEGGDASDTSRLLTVSASYAALPVISALDGAECSPSPIPTECSITRGDTLSLFREFAGQTLVFRYKAPQDQLPSALPALKLVADGF